jgi:hypothetical protein
LKRQILNDKGPKTLLFIPDATLIVASIRKICI